jgi:hypothetical protein
MSEAWQKRFALSLEGKSRWQLTDLINKCYKMANSQSGSNYTDGVERDIWKAKAKRAIEKREKGEMT